MTKAAIIISAILVFAGVAAASSLPGIGGSSNDTPTLDTPPLASTNTGATTTTDDVRREDRRADDDDAGDIRREDRRADDDGNQAGEDLRGPCDEAEHAGDPRCTGAQPQRGDDDGVSDRHGANRGHGGGTESGDDGGNSGRDGGGRDD
jgi:hypothetical protein